MVFRCAECEVVSIAIDDEEDRRGEWHSPGSPEIHSIDFGAIGRSMVVGRSVLGDSLASRVNAIDPYGFLRYPKTQLRS